jgi:hypothetical protein
MEATPSRNVEKSDWESQSGDSKDNETASDDFRCLKVVAVAATAGITYDFGASGIMKACIGSMENYTHYFPMGYGRPLVLNWCWSLVRTKPLFLKIFYCWASHTTPSSAHGHPSQVSGSTAPADTECLHSD